MNPVTSRRQWLRGLPWAVAGVATAVGVWLKLRPSPPLGVARATILLPAGQQLDGSGGAHMAAISPDGALMAYVARPDRLYFRLMNDLETKPVLGIKSSKGLREPVFSPDGRSIAFWASADRKLKTMPVNGGGGVTLCSADTPSGMTWAEDGILFGQRSKGIMRISPDGLTPPETLIRVKEGELAHGPQMLPDGKHVLFTVAKDDGRRDRWDRAQVVVQQVHSEARTMIIDGGADARYLQTGHLVYANGATLLAVKFDLNQLKKIGEPMKVLEGVSRAAGNVTGGANYSIANNGSLIYVPGPPPAPMDLAVMSRKGEVEPLNLPPAQYAVPRVSPDGKHILFAKDDDKPATVWIYELSRKNSMRALTTEGNNRFPMWISNKHVAFQSDRAGDRAIWWQPVNGGKAERLTMPKEGESHEPQSAKDDILLFSVTTGAETSKADTSLWTMALKDRKPTPFGSVHSSTPMSAVFSPDGRWVAYAATTGDVVELDTNIYVQPFPGDGALYPLKVKDVDIPHYPRWSLLPGVNELFYDPRAGAFEALAFKTRPTFEFGKTSSLPYLIGLGPPGSRTSYDVTPDGGFVGLITWGQKKILSRSTTEIQLVLNWFEELKNKVP